MVDSRGRKSVIMECGEAVWFSAPYPKRGEVIICPKHRTREKVKNAPGQYRGRCRQCSAGRSYGTSMGIALNRMSAHVRSRPTHTMELLDGYVVIDTVTGHAEELPMVSVDDAPPY